MNSVIYTEIGQICTYKLKLFTNLLYDLGEIQLQVSYFNGHLGVWEPLVEPCSEAENIYRPWEIQFKVGNVIPTFCIV